MDFFFSTPARLRGIAASDSRRAGSSLRAVGRVRAISSRRWCAAKNEVLARRDPSRNRRTEAECRYSQGVDEHADLGFCCQSFKRAKCRRAPRGCPKARFCCTWILVKTWPARRVPTCRARTVSGRRAARSASSRPVSRRPDTVAPRFDGELAQMFHVRPLAHFRLCGKGSRDQALPHLGRVPAAPAALRQPSPSRSTNRTAPAAHRQPFAPAQPRRLTRQPSQPRSPFPAILPAGISKYPLTPYTIVSYSIKAKGGRRWMH